MINFDEEAGENTYEHSFHWQQIPGHPYRILIVDGSAPEKKANALHNLISYQPRIDKIF